MRGRNHCSNSTCVRCDSFGQPPSIIYYHQTDLGPRAFHSTSSLNKTSRSLFTMEEVTQPSKSAQKKAAKKAGQVPIVGGKKEDSKEIIGMTASKETNFSLWYQELVVKAELVEYYHEISGFYILRPAAMYTWNIIRKWFQERIEAMGVEETSFPMFLSSKSLEKEKDHVEGFAPELAWVTKAGDKDLEVPVAVRPTSEAVMYPYYAKWIRSHRDLPFRLNQWNNVVRWEAKQTTPFLRAREFLWQEGHTAHLNEESSAKEVLEILELYAGVYEQLLAVPVVRGKKTENEKFAGGHWTTTVEGYIPANGRGIQGATSHCLGQNFSKMFDVTVEDPDKKGEKLHVWQNSWGLSTRVIGVMCMLHGDDKGLVMPPRVARLQTILIPVGITNKMSAEDKVAHGKKVEELYATLKKAGVRVDVDNRDGYTPGFKFAEWELKGVPLRIEFGPKDAAKDVVSYARRDTGEKGTIPVPELATKVPELLEEIQKALYDKADAAFSSHRLVLTDWSKVVPALDSKNVVLIPFCEEPACEEKIKETTKSEEPKEGAQNEKQPSMGMKSLCIPFDQPEGLTKETKCLNPECSAFAKSWTMFGRSY
ncbi:proline-tRNA ligase-like protein [Xylariaceae sp. AK1471]|nr:proline-tRNA ligase-like protein [Xylariaceae sp. AK1471]